MLGQAEVLEKEEPREMVFRDTDTKYIRLAKMGGRKDLLTIQPNSSEKKQAVPYPRSEWFYLEDNALEEKEQKQREQEQWQFLLPEYMVHQSYQAGQTDQPEPEMTGKPMRRAPYATSNEQSSFYEDGHSLTDKTVKIPETKRPGYGVRSAKGPTAAVKKQQPPKVERAKPISSQKQAEKPRPRYPSMPSEKEEPVSMSKLLSNAYDAEWHEKLQKWHEKQGEHLERGKGAAKTEGPVRSEYNNNYSKPTSSTSHRGDTHRRPSGSKTDKTPAAKKEEEKPKEPFKLSKYGHDKTCA
nr:hypothetical protein BaRGS_000279 [Batillaria attramentaria]